MATIAHTTPQLWRETFVLPRELRITSEFGRPRSIPRAVPDSRHLS
jgi:hypothetical protein